MNSARSGYRAGRHAVMRYMPGSMMATVASAAVFSGVRSATLRLALTIHLAVLAARARTPERKRTVKAALREREILRVHMEGSGRTSKKRSRTTLTGSEVWKTWSMLRQWPLVAPVPRRQKKLAGLQEKEKENE